MTDAIVSSDPRRYPKNLSLAAGMAGGWVVHAGEMIAVFSDGDKARECTLRLLHPGMKFGTEGSC